MVTNSFSGTDTIGGLSFDGGATWQEAGTWGSSTSTAANKDSHFTGAGILNVAMAITVTAQANTKSYDGGTSSATAPTYTGTLATGDTITPTETYDSKNVGTGKTLTPRATIMDSGNNDVTANYAITYVTNTTGVINQTNLTVTAAANTKLYDGTTSAAATPTY